MRRTATRAIVLAAIGALLLAAAACGSGHDSSTPDVPPESEPVVAESDCAWLEDDDLAALADAAVSGDGDVDMDRMAEFMDAAADRAPDEIREDFGLLADMLQGKAPADDADATRLLDASTHVATWMKGMSETGD
jgi:hypothetical protein